jgi:Major Facilitator Superfamily
LARVRQDRSPLGAWWATAALFLVHGLVVSTWVSRIPAVQAGLHLDNGILGLTLFATAVGAVSAITLAGWSVTRFGSKKTTTAASIGFSMSVVLPALATNAQGLALALFVLGALAAAMDVSMNAQGVEVEKELGRPTMSRFHGMFSVGGMLGAGAGGFAAAHGAGALPHFAVSALANGLIVAAVSALLLETHDAGAATAHRLPWSKIPPVLLALSAIGFCILLAEGAMADWTAVYLRQILHAGPGTAASGYAVFSAAMAIFRLLGDWVTARLGTLRTLRTGSLVAAAGLLWALSMQSPGWSLPGFAMAGAGFSVIIPLVFGSGGRVDGISPGAGIATVTGIGYVGFMVGPPAIGFASRLVTLRYALGIVVACCVASALLAKGAGSPARSRLAPGSPSLQPDGSGSVRDK